MRKSERQQLIRTMLLHHSIKKQSDFVAGLKKEGVAVTQATVSRDIREMHLVKVPADDGGYRYSLPDTENKDHEQRLKQVLADAYVSLSQQNELLLLKTLPGNGPATASFIDQIHYPELFGTIGDDDTVLMIARSAEAASRLMQRLQKLI
ncbi:arginine repressor ArgR [Lactobacillus selangorensis]|uniref:Arginine repressor n=1 Tax=Lactobacillus selangorensis TaxID=81857 RepID=A0A0R2FM23_9LACO|nr:arginine repressor [Lactobacillus selangorensis]KRN29657.1 arginine repressor ArgR [Lactobacillus selangorensis]KRN33814.1 arginine repressor ArgR [Lactobacillus selangorensis]